MSGFITFTNKGSEFDHSSLNTASIRGSDGSKQMVDELHLCSSLADAFQVLKKADWVRADSKVIGNTIFYEYQKVEFIEPQDYGALQYAMDKPIP